MTVETAQQPGMSCYRWPFSHMPSRRSYSACSMTATRIMSKLISSTGWRSKAGAVLREHVADKMTPAKISEAQRLAQEWKPKGK